MIMLGRVSQETRGAALPDYEDLSICQPGGDIVDEDDVCRPK